MSIITAEALRKSARKTFPVYRKIAKDPVYALRLSHALRNSDLDKVETLLKQATSGFNTFGANPGGFDIGYSAQPPADEIFNATSVKGRGTLTATGLAKLSRRILPLYRKISCDKKFSTALVLAAKAGNHTRLRRLIAPLIPNNRLVSVRGDKKSIVLEIKTCDVVFINQFFVL
ncbi:hypothetical protein L1N85_25915 [Paenibacillus alkaliterrae]|uniref:hypothetical protein n=1 Tax=Paenibacillus alkaliterrae TaxID=320909 RepID=UPI001F489F00|nr:hypothetical protein [Paenibacillus alkaliterrae]MCF2941770.1 hypothetical protein [Paenibacillus alkaliterrae]